eukprot:CAMPEP_0179095846 /NCGR_PEP_ID=MMETSP0796-20121207/44027_1 /TAXON_ID=73915 /ORGANISM="Pyrodinium bahamense, Strain pbaha01" /LENGTH=168 /DNA_ID=CAMNT_0020793543 /DNA_START=18 /DNA_END=521 /DNA_ORIENTATION=-
MSPWSTTPHPASLRPNPPAFDSIPLDAGCTGSSSSRAADGLGVLQPLQPLQATEAGGEAHLDLHLAEELVAGVPLLLEHVGRGPLALRLLCGAQEHGARGRGDLDGRGDEARDVRVLAQEHDLLLGHEGLRLKHPPHMALLHATSAWVVPTCAISLGDPRTGGPPHAA